MKGIILVNLLAFLLIGCGNHTHQPLELGICSNSKLNGSWELKTSITIEFSSDCTYKYTTTSCSDSGTYIDKNEGSTTGIVELTTNKSNCGTDIDTEVLNYSIFRDLLDLDYK